MDQNDQKDNVKIEISSSFPVEKALKKFKRLCDQFGIAKEYKKRKEYRKPSIRNKEKLAQAEKRRNKAERKFRGKGPRKGM